MHTEQPRNNVVTLKKISDKVGYDEIGNLLKDILQNEVSLKVLKRREGMETLQEVNADETGLNILKDGFEKRFVHIGDSIHVLILCKRDTVRVMKK